MFFTWYQPGNRHQTVGILGTDQPGRLAFDVIELAKQASIVIKDRDRQSQILVGDDPAGDILDQALDAVVFVTQILRTVRRVGILGQVQDLTGMIEVPPPDCGEITGRIADGVGDEQVKLKFPGECDFQRGLEDRTQVGTEV